MLPAHQQVACRTALGPLQGQPAATTSPAGRSAQWCGVRAPAPRAPATVTFPQVGLCCFAWGASWSGFVLLCLGQCRALCMAAAARLLSLKGRVGLLLCRTEPAAVFRLVLWAADDESSTCTSSRPGSAAAGEHVGQQAPQMPVQPARRPVLPRLMLAPALALASAAAGAAMEDGKDPSAAEKQQLQHALAAVAAAVAAVAPAVVPGAAPATPGKPVVAIDSASPDCCTATASGGSSSTWAGQVQRLSPDVEHRLHNISHLLSVANANHLMDQQAPPPPSVPRA